MPGLNTIIRYNGESQKSLPDLSPALDKMNFDPTYFHNVVYEDKNSSIFFSGYEGYPRHKINLGDKTLVIEGAIYNKSMDEVKSELGKLLPDIVSGKGQTDKLRDFMFNTDGEFVIYYFDNAASTVVIFNDALGRLPAYLHIGDKGVTLGRALTFMRAVLPDTQYDDNALMEYFLFSTPLGDKTFYKNIYRLMPCSLIVINLKAAQAKTRVLHAYNFDDRWDDRPIERHAKELHDAFLTGVANRARMFADRTQVLSLSGGLDSRTNLMGLLKNKIKFEAITFLDYFNLLGRDLPVVRKLEKVYGINVKLFKLIEESIPYFERMVQYKDGNGLMGTMGSVLYSMEVIEKEYGKNSVFYTGDEGNYITAPRYGGNGGNSTEEMVKEILLKNSLSVFSIEETAQIFGKTPKAVTDYLCDYYSRYPEKSNVHKIDRYFFWERSFKFTMENQDRIRLFFWPIAPHYCIQHARYALQISNKDLAGWKVYREFLKALDSRSASIKYANFGIALDSPLMSAYLPLRAFATSNETIRRNALVFLRLLRNPTQFGRKTTEWGFIGEFRNYLKNLTEKTPSASSHFNTKALHQILADEKYLYKMYLSGNIIKYMSLAESKEQMSGSLK